MADSEFDYGLKREGQNFQQWKIIVQSASIIYMSISFDMIYPISQYVYLAQYGAWCRVSQHSLNPSGAKI